jgi:hypothetical protein
MATISDEQCEFTNSTDVEYESWEDRDGDEGDKGLPLFKSTGPMDDVTSIILSFLSIKTLNNVAYVNKSAREFVLYELHRRFPQEDPKRMIDDQYVEYILENVWYNPSLSRLGTFVPGTYRKEDPVRRIMTDREYDEYERTRDYGDNYPDRHGWD